MSLKQHTIQASVGSMILAPFLGVDAIVFFFSMILIDVDHYFDFVVVCRRFGIRDMFKYHNWVWKQKDAVYGLSLFHTAEVLLLLFILGYWSHYFWLTLLGFSVHIMFDLYFLYKHYSFFSRAFSIIEYLIKKNNMRRYPVPDKRFWG